MHRGAHHSLALEVARAVCSKASNDTLTLAAEQAALTRGTVSRLKCDAVELRLRAFD